MTELPDIKLRALANFPVAVTGRVATKITKVGNQYFIDHDVSGLVQNPNISAGDVAASWMTIWNKTLNAYQNVPYALAATSGVSSIKGQTGALDLGAGLTMTGSTIDLTPTAVVASIHGKTGALDIGTGLAFTGSTLGLDPGLRQAQYATRAGAMALDLSAYTILKTWAYDASYTPNSGATFVKIAPGTPFLDSYPLTGTIVGGTLYTNGTYYGVPMSGGSGVGLIAQVTVAGGAVTAVSFATQPGNAYAVGDVLTPPAASIGGTGSGCTFTIATVSTPIASFIDVAGNRWQYTPDTFPHVNQFGAKPDWNGTDAGATNNFTAFQSALFFGGYHSLPEGLGALGNRVLCGYGIYLLTSSPAASLIVPFGVFLEGVGGTNLKFGDVFDINTHCVTLGDPNSRQACFRSGLRYLTLTFPRGIAVSSGIAMVYSNSTQDGGGLEQVYMYAGQRIGIKFEIGYGGASTVILDKVSISYEGANPAVSFNYGSTVVDVRDLVIGAPSSGFNATVDSIVLNGSGGMYKFDGGHTELVPNGFNVNLTGSAQVTIKNWTGGNGCTQLVTLATANTPGNLSLEQCAKNGATRLVTNGQPSGSNRAGDVQPKDGIVFFFP